MDRACVLDLSSLLPSSLTKCFAHHSTTASTLVGTSTVARNSNCFSYGRRGMNDATRSTTSSTWRSGIWMKIKSFYSKVDFFRFQWRFSGMTYLSQLNWESIASRVNIPCSAVSEISTMVANWVIDTNNSLCDWDVCSLHKSFSNEIQKECQEKNRYSISYHVSHCIWECRRFISTQWSSEFLNDFVQL